jgi:hypothetical protein
MGLLDDAIREHLELKRRHGADPDEVTRQEREALGAPVRGEFAKPAGEEPDEGDEPAAVAAGGQAPAGVPEFDEPPEMPGEPEPEPVERAIAPEPEPEPEPGDEEDPWLVEELADPEPRPEPAAEAPEAAEAPAAPAEGEDVLEETPEFLQETPEHERLWFEQKPPRDFDWDK